jgi:hypothetical protein
MTHRPLREHRDKMCRRKKKFGRAAAVRIAAELRRTQAALSMKAYRCRYCHTWHVGHDRGGTH